MKKPTLNQIKDHIRNRSYMSGVDRDKLRIKAYGEVFTPVELIREMLDGLPQEIFGNPDEKFLDPTGCGDGAFLGEVLIKKVENGLDFETALKGCFGIDIQQDNVDLCRERLLCNQEHLRHIVEKNIICADCDKVKNFSFDGTDPYKSEQDLHNERLFEIS